MKRYVRIIGFGLIILTFFGLIPPAASAQDTVLEDIAGDFVLNLGDRTLPFTILLKDAALFFDARVPGVDPQPMTFVEGMGLTYKSLDLNGRETFFAFILNEQRKVTGCTVRVPVQDVEAKAVKIEKR
jgi:hypothetical protein